MSKVEDILASTKVGDVLDAAKLNKFLKRQEEEAKITGSWTERILWDGQMIWTFRFWGITKSHGEIMR